MPNLHPDANAIALDIDLPFSFQDTMKRKDAPTWKCVMEAEMESLNLHNVAEEVDLPNGERTLDMKWVYMLKSKPDGNTKNKSQLCVRGDQQRPRIDYTLTFAPTMKMQSFHLLCAQAVKLKYIMRQFDIKTAFLNGDLSDVIYVKQPLGFVNPKAPHKVWKLLKSMYGLCQAPCVWWQTLQTHLMEVELVSTIGDEAIFIGNLQGKPIYVGVFVDNMPVAVPNMETGDKFRELLKACFHVHDLGQVKCILGMEFHQDPSTFAIMLTQHKYTQKLLNVFHHTDAHPASTPLPPGIKVSAVKGELLGPQNQY